MASSGVVVSVVPSWTDRPAHLKQKVLHSGRRRTGNTTLRSPAETGETTGVAGRTQPAHIIGVV